MRIFEMDSRGIGRRATPLTPEEKERSRFIKEGSLNYGRCFTLLFDSTNVTCLLRTTGSYFWYSSVRNEGGGDTRDRNGPIQISGMFERVRNEGGFSEGLWGKLIDRKGTR